MADSLVWACGSLALAKQPGRNEDVLENGVILQGIEPAVPLLLLQEGTTKALPNYLFQQIQHLRAVLRRTHGAGEDTGGLKKDLRTMIIFQAELGVGLGFLFSSQTSEQIATTAMGEDRLGFPAARFVKAVQGIFVPDPGL